MRPPLRSPTVVRPLLFVHHRARDNLVGCCVQLSIGGRLKQQRILIYSFFAPKSDGQKGVTAFSPIVSALRAASHKYTPTMRPTFGWLLRLAMQQEPSQSEAPSPSPFLFFRRSIRHLKRWANVLQHTFRPCASPLQCPPPHRNHRSVGCCFEQSSSGHSRPVLRPSRNIQMGAILAPQRRGPNVARASPDAGRLHQAHREPRCRDSVPWRMMPWRGRRAKPLGGRVSSGSSCVLCFFVGELKSYIRAWYEDDLCLFCTKCAVPIDLVDRSEGSPKFLDLLRTNT